MIDRMHPQQARPLEQLYHDNFDLLTIYAAASLKSRSRAQDVVQDIFHEAARHIDTLTEHPNPGGWLMVTLKNKLREAERAQRLYLLHFLSLDTDLPVEPRGQDPQPEDRLDEGGPPVLETIFHILRLMKQREQEAPTGRLPDVGQAWADFQEYDEIPEGADQVLYPCAPAQEEARTAAAPASRRPRRLVKKSFAVAAILVALLCGLVTAQQIGGDPIYLLQQLNADTFHFDFSAKAPTDRDATAAFQDAAARCGIPSDLVPTWSPAGFAAAEPAVMSVAHRDLVSTVYTDETMGRSYTVWLERYDDPRDIEVQSYAKGDQPIQLYAKGGKAFCIMSDRGVLTAVWSDGTYLITIEGGLSMDELTSVIDSIGKEQSLWADAVTDR